jgi:hypothetical protein
MKKGKERADLRTAALKELLAELERKRDQLLNDIFKLKGELEATETFIKRTYDVVVDINKEERIGSKKESKSKAS